MAGFHELSKFANGWQIGGHAFFMDPDFVHKKEGGFGSTIRTKHGLHLVWYKNRQSAHLSECYDHSLRSLEVVSDGALCGAVHAYISLCQKDL